MFLPFTDPCRKTFERNQDWWDVSLLDSELGFNADRDCICHNDDLTAHVFIHKRKSGGKACVCMHVKSSKCMFI